MKGRRYLDMRAGHLKGVIIAAAFAALTAAAAGAAEAGTISGLVTDQNDRPLSGAFVKILGPNLFTTTNADGYYVIQKVPAGTYDVKATHSGCEEQVKPRVKVIAGLRTNVSFELYKIPVGVILIAPEDPAFWYRDLLLRSPVFPEEYINSYIADKYADMLVSTRGFVYDDSDASTLNLHIRGSRDSEAAEAGAISGAVTDRDGRSLSDALVVVLGTNLFTTTNADGYYVIREVPAGKYEVKASRHDFDEQVESGVKVIAGSRANVSFQLRACNTGVTYVRTEEPPFWYRDLLLRSPVFPEEYINSYIADKYADMLVRTPGLVYEDGDASAPDEKATGDSEAAEVGTISGLVTDQYGQPLSGVLVKVLGPNLHATTNADGYYVIQDVPVGMYDVKATSPQYEEHVETAVEVTPSAKTNVSFQLQSFFKLLHE
jgi:protocatechuate 3,4-dioxygenase beta subunit